MRIDKRITDIVLKRAAAQVRNEEHTDGFWDEVAEAYGCTDYGELSTRQKDEARTALARLARKLEKTREGGR